LRSEIPEFSNAEEARKYLTGKFILTINIENEEIFRETDDFWLPEKIRFLLKKRTITHSDYLALLDPSVSYNLGNFNTANIDESYSLFRYKNQYVGETYAFASIEGSFFPVEYGFVLRLIVDTSIVTISLKLHDASVDIPQRLPEYFYYNEKYKTYMWNDDVFKTRAEFYQNLLDHRNGKMPIQLRYLVEKWNLILNSLEIGDHA
jgi:hypothetical protein